MPNFINAFSEVVTRALRTLTSQTNIRQVASGSKARSFLEVHAKEVDNISRRQDADLKKVFLPTTYGQFLDHYAATVNLSKFPQKSAEASATDRVFRFFVRGGGNFGSINDGQGINIPEGIQLSVPMGINISSGIYLEDDTEDDMITSKTINYITTQEAAALSTDTELFVSAKAMSPGSGGNIAAPGMIRRHNFNSYTDYLGKTLLIENIKPVLNGVDEEDESSFKYRISKEITAIETSNEVAIRNAALAVPGVADVVIIPWEDGAARFNVYIKSIAPTVSEEMLRQVQVAINAVVANGCIGYARRPYNIGIEIDSTIKFRDDVTDEYKVELRRTIAGYIVRYLNDLRLGQSLMLQSLVEELKEVRPEIVSVGFDKTTYFDGVFAWYPARMANGGKRRERLMTNVLHVPSYARITAESSVVDPVRLV